MRSLRCGAMTSKALQVLALSVVMTIVVAACEGDGADITTTSQAIGGGGGDGGTSGSTTTVPEVGEATTTTEVELVGSPVESYEIVGRDAGDAGETLWIVIPQAAYTDVDLENFMGNLIENGTATWGAEVFDDILALEAYQKPEADRTEDELALIEQHHFVTLQNGDTIIFRGPFEGSGEMVIGS